MSFTAVAILLPLVLAAQEGAVSGSGDRRPPQPTTVQADDLCSIEGRVTSTATGGILKDASLTLRRNDSPARGLPKKYAASSDVTGHFVFSNVAPGSYTLSATRTGFVDAEYGARNPNASGTAISLDAGRHITGLEFRLIPNAVIAGRVTGEDGEPVPGVDVYALYYRYPQGRKRLASYDSATTNDRGEYRIYDLAPGRYYICAATPQDQPPPKPPATAGQEPKLQYVNTFLPHVTGLAAAAPLDVAAGVELTGMNIELSRQPVVNVTGRVVDGSISGLKKLAVYLMPRESVALALTATASSIDKRGNFEVDGVAPGSYTLVATMWDQDKEVAARAPLEVGRTDIDGVRITLNPVMVISGRVRVDSQKDGGQPTDQTPVDLTAVEVALDARNPNAQRFIWIPTTKVNEDGAFSLADVTPETYNVTLSGLPDGLYLKSVRVNGEDRLAQGLILSGPGDKLDIVLGTNAGQAAGLVKNDQDQPASGTTVVLVPQEKERRDQALLPDRYYRCLGPLRLQEPRSGRV